MCIPEHPHALACTNPLELTNTYARSQPLSLAHTRKCKCTYLIRWVHHLLVIEAEAGGLVVGGRHLRRLVREQPRLVPCSCIAVGQLIEHAAVLHLRGQQLAWEVVNRTTRAAAGGSRRWGRRPMNVQVKGGWVRRWGRAYHPTLGRGPCAKSDKHTRTCNRVTPSTVACLRYFF